MRKGTCKHFNGILSKTCEYGMDYERFRQEGRSMLKTLPCFNAESTACPHRTEPTQFELDAYEQECSDAMAPILEIDAAVSRGDRTGTVPHSCGGTIHWVWSGPLAMRAKCDNCDWSAMS